VDNEMTSKPLNKFLILTITIWSVSAVVGCSTFTPIPTATVIATETATFTKTPIPSVTITSAPQPSPTPYNGPKILFYVREDNQLFSINADGGNPREIAQGILFSFSPDKKKLVYRTAETYFSNEDEVVVWDLLQEEVIYRWSIPGYCEGVFKSSEFSWSPDSQRIAFTLTVYDAADALPNCGLQYNYEDMGIYQIDLMSTKITHPPLLTDTFVYNYPYTAASYSPDGLKLRLRLGSRGEVFDLATWEKIPSEPFYDVFQLCDRPEKIGICNGSDLCLYDDGNRISKHLTQYRELHKSIDTFKLLSDCSALVYETEDRKLHLVSLRSETNDMIGTNVWEYFLTPDNGKIVFYQQEWSIEDASIFVVNSDGSNKQLIAEFPHRRAPIYGPLMVLSPTGEKVAFVNREGIAIINLDGNDFEQLVKVPDGASTNDISLEILGWH
jgi:hypothetical protein